LSRIDVTCPSLGDFKDVPIVDVLVKVGEQIEVDTPLVTLETDKATMDVPSTVAGQVVQLLIEKGGRVSRGTPLVRVESADSSTASEPAKPAGARAPTPSPAPTERTPATERAPAGAPPRAAASNAPSAPEIDADRSTQLLVLGAGPGGYTAAFRAADLGLKVTLIERYERLGGVCLNVGCIPSKALLHAAKVIDDAHAMREHGIVFGEPQLELSKLRSWKGSVVQRLTGGLVTLAKQRKVDVIRGSATFLSPHVLEVVNDGRRERIRFEQCVIAAGSQAAKLPFLPQDPRILDSTSALELPTNPGRFLVIGGGIIGLEMACIYEALGAQVSVVELTPQLMPGCDADLVRPLERRIRKRYGKILLDTRVTGVIADAQGLQVTTQGADGKSSTDTYDYVLVAVGRTPNGKRIAADRAGVEVDERGFIRTDKQMRTNVPHIFAIGDIAGPPMLAHKASHEGKVAAEVAAGHKSFFDAHAIPSVAYTDPEVAWVGLTESAAKAEEIAVERASFPWVASGRSLSLGRDEGFTKLLFDPHTRRLLGAGIVGTNAGELIAEATLAIEMGADAADIGLTVHAHPTLSETVAFAADAYEGTLTDLYLPKRSR
jgi:dihydrolipoamide dehydrogenase